MKTLLERLVVFFIILCAGSARANNHEFVYYDNCATQVAFLAEWGETNAISIPMQRLNFGEFRCTVDIPCETIFYGFSIDQRYHVSDPDCEIWTNKLDGHCWSVLTADTGKTMTTNLVSIAFYYRNEEAHHVAVAGEFNNWQPDTGAMTLGSNGIWSMVCDVPEGVYAYKLVVDGEWLLDPDNPLRKTVDGTENSLLITSNYLARQKSSRLENHQMVHFQFYGPLYNKVSIAGSFNGWSGTAAVMNRLNHGAWTLNLALPPGLHEYKMVADQAWLYDPLNPNLANPPYTMNSVIEVPSEDSSSNPTATWRPFKSVDSAQPTILLTRHTALHAFQQELYRQYARTILDDFLGYTVIDESLLGPFAQEPREVPTSLQWYGKRTAEATVCGLQVNGTGAVIEVELDHPLLGPPEVWLEQLDDWGRKFAVEDIRNKINMRQVYPEPESDWANGLEALEQLDPWSTVRGINLLTNAGRNSGWNQALLRSLAIAYADLARSLVHISGQISPVCAARAVVYANLARHDSKPDETMAYVLAMIGREGDAKDFLPQQAIHTTALLATAAATMNTRKIERIVGTPDYYGFAAKENHPSFPPCTNGLASHEFNRLLREMGRLLLANEMTRTASGYQNAYLEKIPADFSVRFSARSSGGIGSGHRHMPLLWAQAQNPLIWKTFLDGDALPADLFRTPDDTLDATRLMALDNARALQSWGEAIPRACRWDMLRAVLDTACWNKAFYLGRQYFVRKGSEKFLKDIEGWKSLSPRMYWYACGITEYVRKAHDYKQSIQALAALGELPATMLDYYQADFPYRTHDSATMKNLLAPAALCVNDLSHEWAQYVQLLDPPYEIMNNAIDNIRRLSPYWHKGYTLGQNYNIYSKWGETGRLYCADSYGYYTQMGRFYKRTHPPVGDLDKALDAYYHACALGPWEPLAHLRLTDLYMQAGNYEQVIHAVHDYLPDEGGLAAARMRNKAAIAYLQMGQYTQAVAQARQSATTYMSSGLETMAYCQECLGDLDAAEYWYRVNDKRYDSDSLLKFYIRCRPDKARDMVREKLKQIEAYEKPFEAYRNKTLKENPWYAGIWYHVLQQSEKEKHFLASIPEKGRNVFSKSLFLAKCLRMRDKTAAQPCIEDFAASNQCDLREFAQVLEGRGNWHKLRVEMRLHRYALPILYMAAQWAHARNDYDLETALLREVCDHRNNQQWWHTLAVFDAASVEKPSALSSPEMAPEKTVPAL